MSSDTPLTQFDTSSQALLRLLCWFSDEPIPFSVVQTRQASLIFDGWAKRLDHVCGSATAHRASLQTTLEELTSKAIFQTVSADGDFRVDHDVRMSTRVLIPRDQQRLWLRCAMMMIHASIKSEAWSASTNPVIDSLHSHIDAIVAAGESARVQHDVAVTFLTEIGRESYGRGEFSHAETLFRCLVTLDQRKFGADNFLAAANERHVARVLAATDRKPEAESLLRKSLESLEKGTGSDSAWLCDSLYELAKVLYLTKRLTDAEFTSRRALGIREEVYGPANWIVACGLDNLALILELTDPEQARLLLHRALEIDQRAVDAPRSLTARLTYALAWAMGPAHRLAEIEVQLRRAGEINLRISGPDHPAYAESLYWDSVRLGEEQEFDTAEECVRKSMSIHEKCGNKCRSLFFRDLNQLALLHSFTKRFDEAESLNLRVRSEYEQRPGFASLSLGACLNNLAQLYQTMQRYSEADLLFRQSLGIHLQFGADTGRRHRQLPYSVRSYRGLLSEMNFAQDEIEGRLQTILQPFGECPDDLKIPSEVFPHTTV